MKVAILKLSAIGDILHALKPVYALKKAFPNLSISWIVEEKHEEILKSIPWIDEIITVDTYRIRRKFFSKKTFLELNRFSKLCFDLIYDLQGNSKSVLFLHLIKAHHKIGFGWRTISEKIALLPLTIRHDVKRESTVYDQYLEVIKAFPQFTNLKFDTTAIELDPSLFNEPIAAGFFIAIGSNWENKRLKTEDWIQIVQYIEKKTNQICYLPFSTEKEEAVVDAITKACHLAKKYPKSSLVALQHGFKHSLGVIGVDSALLHLASLANVKTFAIFGPSKGAIFSPNQDMLFQAECPIGYQFIRRCPKLRTCPHGNCLKELQLEALLNKLDRTFLREF